MGTALEILFVYTVFFIPRIGKFIYKLKPQSQFGTKIMRVIALKNIRDFCLRYPDADVPLKAWAQEARKSRWKSPQDIKNRYSSASFLKGNRVVFSLRGNEYRLVVAVAYRFEAVYVKFIGTHAQYDAVDAETIEME